MQKRLAILGGLLAATCWSQSAQALVTTDIDPNIDLVFSNPGARANAMGGAFIGVADDATAAYTNPAGLTILTKAETSVEVKQTEQTSRIILEDKSVREYDNSTSGISFLGYAKPSGKSTFAVYRHEFLNIDFAPVRTPAPTTTGLGDLPGTEYEAKMDIRGATYGVGLGLKLHDRLSLGGSVGFAQLNYHYSLDRLYSGYSSSRNHVSDSATSEQYSVALLANPVGDLNLGLVYKYGPKFNTSFSYNSVVRVDNVLKVPDMYGAGLSYRLFNSLTVAADVSRIMYSELVDDYFYFDRSKPDGMQWIKNTGEFQADDTTEFHVGFEYVIDLGQTPLAVRGGYCHRPDHSIYYTGTAIPYYATTRQKGDDDNIYSLGLGAVLAENIQLDLAASLGDFVKEYNFSLVYRFD